MGTKYWEKAEASVNGMLGGYESTSDLDIEFSKLILDEFISEGLGTDRCIDCGAGIGRITKDMLIDRFTRCDIVEGNE